MTINYAAYGSNLHPLRLAKRLGEVKHLGTGRMDDFALRFHKRGNIDGSGKCNFIEHAGSCVCLAIYRLPEKVIETLDALEGVGNGYEKTEILSEDYGRCLIYRAEASHIDDDLAPFTWYKDLVLEGCRYHQFPDEYIETVANVPAIADPEHDRTRRYAELVEALQASRLERVSNHCGV